MTFRSVLVISVHTTPATGKLGKVDSGGEWRRVGSERVAVLLQAAPQPRELFRREPCSTDQERLLQVAP